MHAVFAEMVGADIGDDRRVGALDRQAAAKHAAARGFEDRRLYPRIAQHVRAPLGPGVVAALDRFAADEHAIGAVEAGPPARRGAQRREQAHGRGLAVGAGDQRGRDRVQAVDQSERLRQGGQRPGGASLRRRRCVRISSSRNAGSPRACASASKRNAIADRTRRGKTATACRSAESKSCSDGKPGDSATRLRRESLIASHARARPIR